MKLIITGASGYVGQELVRQSLKRPEITTVVALSRKPVSAHGDVAGDSNAAKLRSVVIEDYGEYPENVRKEFEGADACIWTVAITPTKSRAYDFKDVVQVCQNSTMAGLKAMFESDVSKPFRFLYMSGIGVERDLTKRPAWMPEYALMRGQTENQILAFAAEHPGQIEASAAKPGLITTPGRPIASMFARMASWTGKVPYIDLGVIATAMLDQVINGFESDALLNDDVIRMAKGASGPTA
ncbi:NAD(P)-binding protein [Coniochaeta ligniaria NRRL 30616]|uniref:NAD(P)-binding protein n=1 Tax=Coniochaeta ligniaria NRRL 30616 TaxID=1408157 RepID=A0A1J7ILF7_9PEZI|nr:NAD(P)-binding protein [Coniochaeta ligniaria NRRL 30616]